MALYLDGDLAGLADLRDHESGIFDLAKSAAIDLGAKLRLAWGEIGLEIERFLVRNGAAGEGAGLGHVVVTEPMRRSHALLTLALAFRDACCSQGNDRYEQRYRMFEALYRQSLSKAWESGVGIVAQPLRAPETPEVVRENGTGPVGAFYVRVSWINGLGQESAPSEALMLEGNGSTRFMVRMRGHETYATGWNVYAGESPESVTRANERPLGLEESWVAAKEGRPEWGSPGEGQSAERWVREERRLRRG